MRQPIPVVIGAEGNFAFLRAVRNNAHFRAAEIVVEQILKPHARDEQEVPRIGATLLDVLKRAVAVNLAGALQISLERFINLTVRHRV